MSKSRKRTKVDYSSLFEHLENTKRAVTTKEAIEKVPLFKDTLSSLPNIHRAYKRYMKKVGYSEEEIFTIEDFKRALTRYFGNRLRKVLSKRGFINTEQVKTFSQGNWSLEANLAQIKVEKINKNIQQNVKEIDWLMSRGYLSPKTAQYLKRVESDGFEVIKESIMSEIQSVYLEKKAAEAAKETEALSA